MLQRFLNPAILVGTSARDLVAKLVVDGFVVFAAELGIV